MDPRTELSSKMEGFHRVPRSERLKRVAEAANLTPLEMETLGGGIPIDPFIAENLIENFIGYFPLPMGVATHFRIDGRDLFIPMAVEETSIIAAASATAKWVKKDGFIRTWSKGNLIIGQIQLPSVVDPARARALLHAKRDELIALANAFVPGLASRGGGIRDLAFRELPRPDGSGRSMLVLHVLCDPCDAMGANLINQVCEALKPRVEELTGEKVGMCILSNLVDGKLACAEVIVRNVEPRLAARIEEATLFAMADPYRAATHNKGVMNGIDPIVIATGNDWRAVEAGVHAYASRSGSYQPITTWKRQGLDLVGLFEAPLAVGTVGGVTKAHPVSRTALKILGVERADELARICAAVGLVQNLGALRALVTEGIVKGHMQLHATNLAMAAGAEIHEISQMKLRLTEVLRVEKRIHLTRAREILDEIRRTPVT